MNQNCKVSAAGFSIIGDGRYSYNQDTYDIRLNFIPEIPGSFYAGVFDGHGGLNFTEQKSGGAISNFVKKTLPPILEHELRSILFPTKNPSGTVEDLSKHEQKNQSKDDSKDQQSYHEDNGELFINSRYVERAIQNAFQQTTQETKNFLKEAGLLNRGAGGTTAVVALLLQDELYIASVGDSIAFMCFYTESQISTIPLNRKHNWCWADESARIQQKGGNFHQQQSGSYLIDENGQNCLNMSRSMADFEYESQGLIHTPDITRHTVTKWRDFALLLASDGVSDIVSTKDCANILGDLYGHYVEAGDDEIIKQELAEISAESIVELARRIWVQSNQKQDTDNITAICVFLQHFQLLQLEPSPPAMTNSNKFNILKKKQTGLMSPPPINHGQNQQKSNNYGQPSTMTPIQQQSSQHTTSGTTPTHQKTRRTITSQSSNPQPNSSSSSPQLQQQQQSQSSSSLSIQPSSPSSISQNQSSSLIKDQSSANSFPSQTNIPNQNAPDPNPFSPTPPQICDQPSSSNSSSPQNSFSLPLLQSVSSQSLQQQIQPQSSNQVSQQDNNISGIETVQGQNKQIDAQKEIKNQQQVDDEKELHEEMILNPQQQKPQQQQEQQSQSLQILQKNKELSVQNISVLDGQQQIGNILFESPRLQQISEQISNSSLSDRNKMKNQIPFVIPQPILSPTNCDQNVLIKGDENDDILNEQQFSQNNKTSTGQSYSNVKSGQQQNNIQDNKNSPPIITENSLASDNSMKKNLNFDFDGDQCEDLN